MHKLNSFHITKKFKKSNTLKPLVIFSLCKLNANLLILWGAWKHSRFALKCQSLSKPNAKYTWSWLHIASSNIAELRFAPNWQTSLTDFCWCMRVNILIQTITYHNIPIGVEEKNASTKIQQFGSFRFSFEKKIWFYLKIYRYCFDNCWNFQMVWNKFSGYMKCLAFDSPCVHIGHWNSTLSIFSRQHIHYAHRWQPRCNTLCRCYNISIWFCIISL